DFIKRFHERHHQLYSYFLRDGNCEIVNLRVRATGQTPGLELERREPVSGEPKVYFVKTAYFNGDTHDFNVYRREELIPGHRLNVPSIVVSEDATVIVPQGYEGEVDEYFNIVLTAAGKR
ncbi:MAG: hypothetical protein GY940_09955, partial [bacterium]|nr:hypothetical protein [bacterium]